MLLQHDEEAKPEINFCKITNIHPERELDAERYSRCLGAFTAYVPTSTPQWLLLTLIYIYTNIHILFFDACVLKLSKQLDQFG